MNGSRADETNAINLEKYALSATSDQMTTGERSKICFALFWSSAQWIYRNVISQWKLWERVTFHSFNNICNETEIFISRTITSWNLIGWNDEVILLSPLSSTEATSNTMWIESNESCEWLFSYFCSRSNAKEMPKYFFRFVFLLVDWKYFIENSNDNLERNKKNGKKFLGILSMRKFHWKTKTNDLTLDRSAC